MSPLRPTKWLPDDHMAGEEDQDLRAARSVGIRIAISWSSTQEAAGDEGIRLNRIESKVGSASPPASSENARRTMSANRGKNTKPELALRRVLREAGYPGYRLHWKAPGRPDIAYPGRKIAIFVNGCFWHRCPRCNAPTPKSNSEFWRQKFEATRERDLRVVAELEASGWIVITVWECELRADAVAAASPALALLRS